MKVSHQRLARLLKPNGFALVYNCPQAFAFRFARRSAKRELYEGISVHAAGKRGEAVPAIVWTGITCRSSSRGFLESEVVREVAEDPVRCWTIIEETQKAKAWEERVATICPPLVSKYTDTVGPEILARTERIRAIRDAYVARIGQCSDIEALRTILDCGADPDDCVRASHATDAIGILQISGAQKHYYCACMMLLRWKSDVEPAEPEWNWRVPVLDRALHARIAILADRLFESFPPT